MANCNECGAHITWLRTPGGKFVPINYEDCEDVNAPFVGQMPAHQETCRKKPTEQLSPEAMRRPGYL